MQKNTKKRGAIISASVVIGFFLLYLGGVLFSIVSDALGDIVGIIALVIFAGLILATVFGVLKALRQRLREIDSGEEEDAKQY